MMHFGEGGGGGSDSYRACWSSEEDGRLEGCVVSVDLKT